MSIEELLEKLMEWALQGYRIAKSPFVSQIFYVLTQDDKRVASLKITNKCIEHILSAALKVKGQTAQIQSELVNDIKISCSELIIPQNMHLCRQVLEKFKGGMHELSLFAAFCFFLQVPQYHGFIQKNVSEVLGLPIFSNNPSGPTQMDGEFEPRNSNEEYAEIVQEDQEISAQAEKPAIQTLEAQNATSTDQPMPNVNKILQTQQHLLSQDQKQVRTIQGPLESKVKSVDQLTPKVGTCRLGGSGSTADEFYQHDKKRKCVQIETSQLQTQQRTQDQQALSSEHEQVINTTSSIEAVEHKSKHVSLRKDTRWTANPQVVCNFEPGFDLLTEIRKVSELTEYADRQRILFDQIDRQHTSSQCQIQKAQENISELTVELAKYQTMEAEAMSNLETAKNETEAAEKSMKNAVKYSFPDEIQQELQKIARSKRFRQADAEIIHGEILTNVLGMTQQIQHLENRLLGLIRDHERLSLKYEKNKLVCEEAEENAVNAEVLLKYSLEVDFVAQAEARVQDYQEIIAEEITEDLSLVIDPLTFSTSALGNFFLVCDGNLADPVNDDLDFVDVDAIPPTKPDAEMDADVKVVTKTDAISISDTEKDAEGCQCEDFTKMDAKAIFSTWLEAEKKADAIPPTKPEAEMDADVKVVTKTDAISISDTEKDAEGCQCEDFTKMDAKAIFSTWLEAEKKADAITEEAKKNPNATLSTKLETKKDATLIAYTKKDAKMDANVEVVTETDANAILSTKPEANTDANAKVVTETDAILIPETKKDVEMNADVKIATEELNEVADEVTIYLPANTSSQNHFLGENVCSVVAISTALINADSARTSKDKK